MAAYIAIVIGRISEIIPGLGSVPVAKIAFALALIGTFSNPKALSSVSLRSLPVAKAGLAFFTLAVLSVSFSIWKGGSVQTLLDGFVTLILSFIFVIKCGASRSAIRALHIGFVAAAALLAVNTLLGYSGGRAGGMSNYDPNDTAFMLVSLTPLIVALAVDQRGIKKLAIWGLTFIVVVAALLTQSRGGLLGLVVISIGMTLFPLGTVGNSPTPKKGPGKFAKIFMMMMASVVIWNFLPGETRERLATIVSPKDDYNMNMKEEGRLTIWQRNLRSVVQRPIGFGVGSFGAVDLRSGGQFRAAHNSFVQVLVELGFLGLFLYLRSYWIAFREIKRMIQLPETQDLAPANPQYIALGRAVRLALIASLVCGFFLSQAYSNLIWLLLAMVASMAATLEPTPGPVVKKRNQKPGRSTMGATQLGINDTAAPSDIGTVATKRRVLRSKNTY